MLAWWEVSAFSRSDCSGGCNNLFTRRSKEMDTSFVTVSFTPCGCRAAEQSLEFFLFDSIGLFAEEFDRRAAAAMDHLRHELLGFFLNDALRSGPLFLAKFYVTVADLLQIIDTEHIHVWQVGDGCVKVARYG